ncbi:o-succinylbenzoic acid (OSB) synthetase [Stanieria cyanosphaera PCC 7437]|uniref:o-succinylbenzoate synthase n=1 Tax=Stanieria cyanosphaera (strain ATCC 29371 / PCC 7437) TaxID=111780 RepID=K9XQ34_STAC7|nr:o-succinylbenzoate synthase [Stanieria cyanosphaera]AFZ34623.1 o-succinylbenzoic acid (OSB) synthetase [Stanieria cyanosphaera PCC 7437]
MSDRYKFQFRLYRRSFLKPLQTSHGVWQVREGIIISLVDSKGKISWGEIAPVPWFGSETLEQALEFCQQLGSIITATTINSIPDHLSACQFGFESALEVFKSQAITPITDQLNRKKSLNYCYLLPAGKSALNLSEKIWRQIDSPSLKSPLTFKWKIGVQSFLKEIEIFQQLLQSLPATTKFRLDANGGLTLEETKNWLAISDRSKQVEFIEQPLAPEHFSEMLTLSNQYQTPLALDESVAQLDQLQWCYQQGWRGIFVIKPAICGFPSHLRQFCHSYSIDAVFSSVFETEIGRQAVLKLAQELNYSDRAVGFGIDNWLS